MTPEAQIQSSLILWWQYAYKGFGVTDARALFHVPNGAYFGNEIRTLGSGKRVSMGAIRFHNLKKQGFVQGVPDLLLIVPSNGKAGLALELKAPHGRLSIDQGQMLHLFEACGWAHCIAWSLDEAVGAITRYLKSGNPLKAT